MPTLPQEKIELEEFSTRILLADSVTREKKLVIEGDSWFDYPFSKDIIDHLRKMGYAIKKHSKHGDTLENMVFGNEYSIKHNTAINYGAGSLEQVLTSIRIHNPRFVLFSAGGNDIVGSEFEHYLNHKNSGLSLFKLDTFQQNIQTSMKTAILRFIESVWEINPEIDILMDGYDYAKPNGVKFKGIYGPWLLPGFARKNILNRKTEQEPIIKTLIDEFNDLLSNIDNSHSKFHHIDLRNKFPDDRMWDNEIHLKSAEFKEVANIYHKKIVEILGLDPLLV